MNAKEIIKMLTEDGHDWNQIHDAMNDGEFLGKTGIDQETAEEVVSLIEENSAQLRKAKISK